MDYLSETMLGENSLMEYLMAVGAIIGCFIAGKIIAHIATRKGRRLAEKTKTKVDDQIVDFIAIFATLLGIFSGLYIAKSMLTLPEIIDKGFSLFFTLVIVVVVTGAIQKILLIIFQNSFSKMMKRNEFGKTIFPFFEKLAIAVLWILAILVFLSNIGFEVSSLVAGLGLGGLAFALAAQDTLGNFISSLSIFMDQPFRVGDSVKIGTEEGTVKEVGIRSTRIQSPRGNTQYIIPNSKIVDGVVENISKRDSVRFDFNIGLVYGTPLGKLKEGVGIVQKILKENTDVQDTFSVTFFSFGDFSLVIKVRFNASLGPDADYDYALKALESVNFGIMEEFEKSGLEFAYPTQTIEMKGKQAS